MCPGEVLAAAALRAVATNEPVDVGVALARRAFAVGPKAVPQPTDLPWFAQASAALVWADAFDETAPALEAGLAESRATGDGAVRHEHGVAGVAAAAPRRSAGRGGRRPHRARRRRPPGAPSVSHHRDGDPRDRAHRTRRSRRGRGGSARLRARRADADAQRRRAAAARGQLLVAQRRLKAGLADIEAAGDVALRTGAVSPAFLAWRSAAALAQLALGEREAALALAREELESAASRAPRACWAPPCASPAS